MPPEGQDMAEHLQQKYGSTPEQFQSNRQMIRERGLALGFDFQMDRRNRVYNTFDAHRLLHWAELQGRQLELKQALFKGGIARSNKPAPASNTPGIHKWEDLELIYAGQRMADGKTLAEYHVPPVSHAIFEYAHAPAPYL